MLDCLCVFNFKVILLIISIFYSVECNRMTVGIINATSKNPIGLNCATASDKTYAWTRLAPGSSKVEKLFVTNSTYNITDSSFTGLYNCSLGANVVKQFQAVNFSKPYIPHSGQSIVFFDGDVNQTIKCISYTYPSPIFTWSVVYPDEQVVVLSDTISKTYLITTGANQSILTISSVSEHARGTYYCNATNAVASDSTSVFIRVHQRIAVLWPFLGIVCEVLIIASIMLVVRRKPVEDSKGSGYNDSSSTDSSQNDVAVRFRKSAKH